MVLLLFLSYSYFPTFVVLLHVSRVYILHLLLLCCLPAAGGKGMSLITGLLITGQDWNPKICFMHCGMQPPSNNYLDFSNFHIPGMHSNCSTIRAGDQLRSYTSEKAVVFSNGYKNDAYITTWH